MLNGAHSISDIGLPCLLLLLLLLLLLTKVLSLKRRPSSQAWRYFNQGSEAA